jgi:hypothetical protein
MTLIDGYLVVIADLVRSRDLENREAAQDRLRATIADLAAREPFASALARDDRGSIPPEITAGDEIQALLSPRFTATSPSPAGPATPGTAALWFLGHLTEALRPLQARVAFGIGFGPLSMRLRRPVRELDGECFHRARAGLEQAKRRAVWAVLDAADTPYPEVANALLRLAGDIRRGWTDRQAEVIRTYERRGVQKDVAEELSVSPSVISEVLHAARYDSVLQAEAAIATVLDWTMGYGPRTATDARETE